MDKNEWINEFQDRMRQQKPANHLKNYVHTREGPFNSKLSASVSPCSWMYDAPFQITSTLVGGGHTVVIDKALHFSDASEADVIRLHDSVKIVKCSTRGCHNPAFDPATSVSHREGKCAPCAIKGFNKELEKAQLVEKKKLEKLDSRSKARGCTHRIDAWLHVDGGDKQISIWMRDPTDDEIRDELLRSGVSDLQSFKLHRL